MLFQYHSRVTVLSGQGMLGVHQLRWRYEAACSRLQHRERAWRFWTFIWANYNNSLTWIKVIWGWFPLLTMIPVREDSEVVIIYPDSCCGLATEPQVRSDLPSLVLKHRELGKRWPCGAFCRWAWSLWRTPHLGRRWSLALACPPGPLSFPLTVLWSQAFVAQILLSCRWEASPLWRTAVLHKGLASHRQVRVCVDLPINRKLLGSGNLFWMKVRLHTWEVPQPKGALLKKGVALAVKSRDVWVTNDSSRAGGAETGPYKDHWVTVSCSSPKLLQSNHYSTAWSMVAGEYQPLKAWACTRLFTLINSKTPSQGWIIAFAPPIRSA